MRATFSDTTVSNMKTIQGEDFLRFMDQVPAHEPAEGDKVK